MHIPFTLCEGNVCKYEGRVKGMCVHTANCIWAGAQSWERVHLKLCQRTGILPMGCTLSTRQHGTNYKSHENLGTPGTELIVYRKKLLLPISSIGCIKTMVVSWQQLPSFDFNGFYYWKQQFRTLAWGCIGSRVKIQSSALRVKRERWYPDSVVD